VSALADLTSALFEVVSRGCPAASAAIGARCPGLRVALRVEGEAVFVVVTREGPRVTAAATETDVAVETSRRTLRALVMGDDEVDAAARGDRLSVVASTGDLVAADEAVRLLVAGAARAPGSGAVLDGFLRFCAGSSRVSGD
jgi:hypothetical protein